MCKIYICNEKAVVLVSETQCNSMNTTVCTVHSQTTTVAPTFKRVNKTFRYCKALSSTRQRLAKL